MRLALLLALALLGSSCSAVPSRDPQLSNNLDRDRMADIERKAWSAGARVHWINPPKKTQPGG